MFVGLRHHPDATDRRFSLVHEIGASFRYWDWYLRYGVFRAGDITEYRLLENSTTVDNTLPYRYRRSDCGNHKSNIDVRGFSAW